MLLALLRGDATHFNRWAAELKTPSDRTRFCNFPVSHEGIGLNPARRILPAAKIGFLVERYQAHSGFMIYKDNADGSKSPYAMNVVDFDALNDPASADSLEIQVNRFMVAPAITRSLAGVPEIHFHLLFGSRDDHTAALGSRVNRRINRQKLARLEFAAAVGDSESLRSEVFEHYCTLLEVRRRQAAFNPHAEQHVFEGERRLFVVLRAAKSGRNWVLCLHNVTNEPVIVGIATGEVCTELWGQRTHSPAKDKTISLTLEPYGVNWLAARGLRPQMIAAA